MGTFKKDTTKKREACLLKKVLYLTMMACLLSLVFEPYTLVFAAETPQALISEATEAIHAMLMEKDTEVMSSLLKNAEGIAIFPSVIKVGLVFGGRYGRGIVLKREREKNVWYGPHFVSIAGASWGLQLGAQATALVMVIMNERGMKGFTGDKVTLGGDLAIAAGEVGRQTGVGTDGGFKAEIYSYSKSKGLFAGVSLEGSIISTDNEANEKFWGSSISVESILNRRSNDREVESLVRAITEFYNKRERPEKGLI